MLVRIGSRRQPDPTPPKYQPGELTLLELIQACEDDLASLQRRFDRDVERVRDRLAGYKGRLDNLMKGR